MKQTAAVAACAMLNPAWTPASDSKPGMQFPSQPRERIAIASYPFRNFIVDKSAEGVQQPGGTKLELKDFAAHVVSKFQINKVELWSGHFPSTELRYLGQLRAAVQAAKASIVNLAADGEQSPYAPDLRIRDQAVAFSKHWIDIAVAVGSPSIRTNLPAWQNEKPNLERAGDSLARVAEYAATRNVIVNLENDNPVSEDPLFLVKLIEKVNSPWLHALPDFANTLASGDAEHAYQGVNAMFGRALNICHVKEFETGQDGRLVRVDLPKTFGFMKQHSYKGYCSMEFDSPGDPYHGTAELIEKTVRFLS